MSDYWGWIPTLLIFSVVVAFYHRSYRQAREGKGWMAEYTRRHTANFWAGSLQPGEVVTAGGFCTILESTLSGYPGPPHAEHLVVAITDRGRVLLSGHSQSHCRNVRSYPRASVALTEVAREEHDPLLKLSPLYWLFGRDQFNCTCVLALPDARMRLRVPSGDAMIAALGVDPRGGRGAVDEATEVDLRGPPGAVDETTERLVPDLTLELQRRLQRVPPQGDPNDPLVACADRPVLFIYERDPRALLIGGESASFALYESGLVVYAAGAPDVPYRAVLLDAPERDALVRDLSLGELAGVPSHCSTIPPGVSGHPPFIELRVAWGGQRRSIQVEPATRARLDDAPLPVRRIVERMVRFDDPRARPWLPPEVEVVLWPFEHARLAPVPWPDAWPAPKAVWSAGERGHRKVFVASRYYPVLRWLVANLDPGQPVSARGRRWSMALRVPLPGETEGAEAIEEEDDEVPPPEDSKSDQPRWIEAVPGASTAAWRAQVRGMPDPPTGLVAAVANEAHVRDVIALLDLPELRSVRALVLKGAVGDEGAAALAQTPSLRALTALTLNNVWIGTDGFEALARSPHLGSLESFDIGGNQPIEARGIAALARSAGFRALRRLDLSYTYLRDDAVVALARSPVLARVEELALGGNRFGAVGVTALGQSPFLSSLKHLSLTRTRLGEAGIAALIECAFLPSLQSLDLGGCEFYQMGERLCGAPFRAMKRLSLRAIRIGTRGVTALARNPHLAGLQDLDLTGAWIGDEGAAALAQSPDLSSLKRLRLCDTGISPTGHLALKRRFRGALIEH